MASKPDDDADRPGSSPEPGNSPSLFREFVAFLANNKRYWLIPIVAMLLLLGLLVFLVGNPSMPFIYTQH